LAWERRTQWGEEPAVLARGVSLLQSLLDGLLGVLTLGNLLEGIGGDNTLQALQLKSVSGWHQVVVVDDLDERLDLAALGLAGLGHTAGDLGWVTLDTGNQGVWVWVRLVASVLWLDDHNLHAHNVSSPFQILFLRNIDRSMKSPLPLPLIACSYVVSNRNRGVRLTFFPAYLPLVMIATRPTLRTVGHRVSDSSSM
jgi:hypothetical protein